MVKLKIHNGDGNMARWWDRIHDEHIKKSNSIFNVDETQYRRREFLAECGAKEEFEGSYSNWAGWHLSFKREEDAVAFLLKWS